MQWTQDVTQEEGLARLAAIAQAYGRIGHVRTTWRAHGRWLRFGDVVYQQEEGGGRTPSAWEMVERTTPRTGEGVDGVDIIALAKRRSGSEKHIVLVVNFRPPTGKAVLEFPAGLVDASDASVETTAVRELREETGLVGSVRDATAASSPFYYHPAMTNDCGRIVVMDVDLDDPVNTDGPGPKPEDHELVEPVLLPLAGLVSTLSKVHNDLGIGIDSRLFLFAQGLSIL